MCPHSYRTQTRSFANATRSFCQSACASVDMNAQEHEIEHACTSRASRACYFPQQFMLHSEVTKAKQIPYSPPIYRIKIFV